MKYIKELSFKKSNSTLIKYFLSYFIILSIMLLGFLGSVRIQLKNIYSQDLIKQAQKRLTNVQEQFENDIYSLNQIQSFLVKDINLVLSRNTNENWYLYQAANTLDQYTVGNPLIDSICYIDHQNKNILSSGKHVKAQEHDYGIYAASHYLAFDLEAYLDSNKSQLILLKDNTTQLLIYLPYNNSITSYTIFYIINNTELNNILANGIDASISSLALLDQNQQIVAGVNTEKIEPFLSDINASSETLFTLGHLIGGYTLTALLSDQAILSQVNIAFRNTYLQLIMIAAVGMLLILWAMRLTYWPLHKLIQKLIPAPLPRTGYVKQLDTAFTTVHLENQQLKEKVESYRVSMQKSILDSIVMQNDQADINKNIDIDPFFGMSPDDHIFILKVRSPRKKSDFSKEMKNFLESSLPAGTLCAVLEAKKNDVVFMIHYPGLEENKEDVLHLLMSDYYEATGCLAAISNSSASPLEIPSLYENALAASGYWSQKPVTAFDDIIIASPKTNTFAYPYVQLETLATALKEQDFMTARHQIQALLALIGRAGSSETPFPDFFTRCVLIDILSCIINYMDRMNTKFKSYSELYFETLYFCRSCSYSEKQMDIAQNIEKLLDTCEAEYANAAIHTNQIQQIIQVQYTSPDFSISTLADYFSVSIAYMSYIFKKKLNENFSDYLWQLRMNKAKELLRTSNMTIDQISEAIGYLNTSSFRRKFKQETGQTPSQFRIDD